MVKLLNPPMSDPLSFEAQHYSVAVPAAKKAKKDFKLNIYSLFFTRHDGRAIIYN
jgi:hypothetical protein